MGKMTSELDGKLDAHARVRLAVGELPRELELLLRLTSTMTARERNALTSVGCRIKGYAGDVVIAVAERNCLRNIADFPFVERIDLSRDLHREAPDAGR